MLYMRLVEFDPVYGYSVKRIVSLNFTKCAKQMDVKPLLLGAFGRPNQRWIGGPNLNSPRIV